MQDVYNLTKVLNCVFPWLNEIYEYVLMFDHYYWFRDIHLSIMEVRSSNIASRLWFIHFHTSNTAHDSGLGGECHNNLHSGRIT